MLKVAKVILAIITFVSFLFFFHWKFTLLLMASILIHEHGHLSAMNFLNIKNKGFIFLPLMGGIVIPSEPIASKMKQVFIYFAGPMAGLFSALLFLIIYSASGLTIFVAMASWSAILNLINMFPITPFDGGMIFRSILNSTNKHLGKIYTLLCAGLVIYITLILLSMPFYISAPFIILSLFDMFIEFFLKKKFNVEENIPLNKPQILITCLSFILIVSSLFTVIKYTNKIPAGSVNVHFLK